MRLERLDLAPYGPFAKRTLRLRPDAALHVVFGANEAGKTTTLSAIGDLLYGFPTETPYGFTYDQRQLRVGGAFRLADGARLDIRRRKGRKDTLLDAEDRPIPDERLCAALGAVDRRTFETELGLTAEALRDGGEALLRAGGSLAETLAAGSASLTALNETRKRLTAEADAEFGPRRSERKPFYIALDAYNEADRKLRDAIVTADALKAAEEEARQAQARLIDLKAQHQEHGRAIARRRRAQRVRPKLDGLDVIAAELADLANLPSLAAPTVAEIRAALEADRVKRAELEHLAVEDAQDAQAMTALGLDANLVAHGAAIDALREQLGAVRKAEIDLPTRVGAQTQAHGQLEELARRLGLADPEAVIAESPTDAALARLRALAGRRRANEKARAEAERRHAAAVAEWRRLGPAGETIVLDPAPLKRRLDGYADAARDAERLRLELAASAREARALREEVAALDPPLADVEGLARAPLPDLKALEARARAEIAAEDALRAAKEKAAAARSALETGTADLGRHERVSAGATRADWDAARARREAALDRLGAALCGPEDLRGERFETARALALTADVTVENVLADTARAARLQAAREALEALRLEFSRAEANLATAKEARAEAARQTVALWAPSGVAPRDPAAMTRWRERVETLRERRAKLEAKQAETGALAAKLDAARATLRLWFTDAGAAPPESEAFEEWRRAAQARLDALQEAKQAAVESETKRKQTERAIAEWAAERDTAIAEAATLAQDWAEAAAELRLAPEAGVEEAEAALEAWAAVPLPRREYLDAGHRIATMRTDIERFERDVETVVATAAPALAGESGREALPKLVARLTSARKAEDERRRLESAASARARRSAALAAERDSLGATLGATREAVGAADDAALAVALDRWDRRARREEERERLCRELAESGDGHDEIVLREEASAFDFTALPAEIELAEHEQAALLNEIGAAAAVASAAEARRDALGRGRDAAAAARERVEAAGELVDVAERWLSRAVAAKLAARAIERHRAAAQDPLIARAGALFSAATAKNFAKLEVGYDDNDRPILVARRASGQTVEVKGLSEGARDQLFLSLRLALLERRAGEPLPFIGDDLLASFDDERARHMLDVLADFGRKRQTILFTHHSRVAELARSLDNRAIEVLEI
jgi:uncharacterized protein YhaN